MIKYNIILFSKLGIYNVYIKISLWKHDLSSLWGKTIQLRMIVSSMTDTSLPRYYNTCQYWNHNYTNQQVLTQNGDALALDAILHHRTVFFVNRTSLHTSPWTNTTIPSNDWMKHTTCFLLYNIISASPSWILHCNTYANVDIVQKDGILDTDACHNINTRTNRYIRANLKDAPCQQLYTIAHFQ